MSLDDQIQATRAAVIHLEKKMRDPQVYWAWKNKSSFQLKELKLELRDLEDKKAMKALEELKQ